MYKKTKEFAFAKTNYAFAKYIFAFAYFIFAFAYSPLYESGQYQACKNDHSPKKLFLELKVVQLFKIHLQLFEKHLQLFEKYQHEK